jgi:hypothetical protein
MALGSTHLDIPLEQGVVFGPEFNLFDLLQAWFCGIQWCRAFKKNHLLLFAGHVMLP